MDKSGNNQCGAKCSTDGEKKYCPVRCFLLPALAVFVAIFAYEWLFHGVIMMPSYKATASLWRPESEMQHLCYVSLIREAVIALVATCLYTCIYSNKLECGSECPVKAGAKLGAKIGMLTGITLFGSYFYLPIPMNMALAWLAGSIVEGVLIGVVLGLIFGMKCKKKDAA